MSKVDGLRWRLTTALANLRHRTAVSIGKGARFFGLPIISGTELGNDAGLSGTEVGAARGWDRLSAQVWIGEDSHVSAGSLLLSEIAPFRVPAGSPGGILCLFGRIQHGVSA